MEATRGKNQVLHINTKCKIIVVYKQINTKFFLLYTVIGPFIPFEGKQGTTTLCKRLTKRL